MRISFLLLPLLFVVGCAEKSADRPSTGALDTVKLAPGGAPAPATPPADSAPVATVDTSAPVVTHVAVISTSQGDIEIELYGKDAPKTVGNFVGLAKKKFYDSLGFHRIVPGWVIQAGDPNTKDTSKYEIWGQGGESIYGGGFADELDTNLPSARGRYKEGIVAMAHKSENGKSIPNTNTSQFFIVLSDEVARQLPYEYTIFGRVRNGMSAVHAIELSSPIEKPKNPIRITSVTVKEVAG